jgi:hypothetical protein
MDGKHYREFVTEVLNRKHIIFHETNPYHHGRRSIVKTDCFPLNGRFYSCGLLEPVEDLQDGINQGYNQVRDVINLILNPMYKVSTGLYQRINDIFEGNLPSIPGQMLPVEEGEDITPIVSLAQLRDAKDDQAFLQEKLQSTTKTSEPMRGNFSKRKETATGILEATERASLTFKVLMKILWYTGFRPMADMMLNLNHQFKSKGEEIKFKDEKGLEQFRKIFMEEVPYDGMAFIPNMAFIDPGLNKEVRARRIEDFAAKMSQTPVAGLLNWRNFAKEIFDLREIRNSDRLLLSEEEVAQMMQRQMLAEQEGGQGE